MDTCDEVPVDGAVWRACGEIAEAVNVAATKAELGRQVMAAIARMVECDVGSILCGAPTGQWEIVGEREDNRVVCEGQWRYGQQMSAAELAQLGSRFCLDTEIFTSRRRERMDVYPEFIQPLGLSGFLARYWVMDGRVWGIGVSRNGRAFSERDRQLMEALFPHTRAALRAATWLGAPEADGVGDGAAWPLTATEQRVVKLVARGLTNKEVAALTGVSANTVRNTLVRVFEKVGASRRSELVYLLSGRETNNVATELRGAQRRHRDVLVAIARGETVGPWSGAPAAIASR